MMIMPLSSKNSGGAEGIRTPDPLDANEVRYRTALQPRDRSKRSKHRAAPLHAQCQHKVSDANEMPGAGRLSARPALSAPASPAPASPAPGQSRPGQPRASGPCQSPTARTVASAYWS